MPLNLLALVDGNGESEAVAAFLVVQEEKETIHHMVKLFKEYSPRWTDIHIIMTDKDIGERAVFNEEMNQAVLHICLFHVLWTSRREITCDKMGITSHDRTTILELLQDMAYAKSEE